jgi:hypothetical protein
MAGYFHIKGAMGIARSPVAEFAFETDWVGETGAIDRSQRLSQAVAAAAHTLAASVAQYAGGAETPGSVTEHVVSLGQASGDLVAVFENMAGQIAEMQRREVLISVKQEGAQAERAAQAVTALSAAAEGARRLGALIADAKEPLLDLTLTDEAETVVWDLYQ